MENNSPRAQSAHCSSHLHYAALQPRARFATACPPGARASARAHTHTRILPGRGPGWVRSAGTGRGCWCGGGGGDGGEGVVRDTRRRLFHAGCLSIQGWAFSCFFSQISFSALFLRLPEPAPSAPRSVELPGRGGDGGDGGWGGSTPSRCHPHIAARGAQRLPALLRTRAQEEQEKHPAFQGEALGAPLSRALQDFPRP